MSDALEQVLALVASGRLTAEEAAPLLDALGTASPRASSAPTGPAPYVDPGPGAGPVPGAGGPRFARIEVRDGGKRVVDLRVPISLGRFALARVPGLGPEHLADVDAAVASGTHGPILDVESPDGDGVRIVLE